ncbi:probable flavin-containing monoamine oxidase A [Strongylocentrotus purpuratus]|uniref:Amine oxidase n=1 Tax=Strongylocentrotus purpuratus TaxID=7668 RepID=A0A7M7SYA6_STRPU|nr:probable flavin-containing monoamine oxidase A [Strongylocentrotus purpuratus]
MAEKRDQECDVVVVGAGLSGLTAAYRIQQNVPGCKVLVVEAKDRIGGRTMTVEMQGAHGPDSWDLGGQWVSSSQHHVLWLLEELGIEHYPQFNSGKRLLQAGKEFGITEHHDSIPSLPLLSLVDLNRFITNLDSVAKYVPSDEPWTAVKADEYDNMTLEQLVESSTWTTVARDTIETGWQVVSGLRLREISALSYMFYLSSSGGLEKLVETAVGSAQELRIKGGSQGISHQLAERIDISNILLSEPVVAIDQSQPEKVKVHTQSGKHFTCKHIIVAAPPHCTGSIQYLPDQPTRRIRLTTSMHPGHLFKFVATYKKAFWREAGYSGEIVCNGSCATVPGCNKAPIQYVLDATSSEGNPALVGFIGNPSLWGQVSVDTRKAAILNHLADFFGDAAKKPIDFMEKDWALEPYNGGCPVSLMTPGAMANWDTIRTPHGRIHWAGTETATQWMGYLNGAVQAGLRAADEVTLELRPQHQRGSQSSEAAEEVGGGLLRALDGRKGQKETTCRGYEGSLIWTMGKLAVVAALVGFAMRKAWLAGGKINLPL